MVKKRKPLSHKRVLSIIKAQKQMAMCKHKKKVSFTDSHNIVFLFGKHSENLKSSGDLIALRPA